MDNTNESPHIQELIEKFNDITTGIIQLTLADPESEELAAGRKMASMAIADFTKAYLTDAPINNLLRAIGKVEGVLELSSTISSESKKIAEIIDRVEKYEDFSEMHEVMHVIHSKPLCKLQDICRETELDKEDCLEILSDLVYEGLVAVTQLGKIQLYSLTNDGSRYASYFM